MKEKKQRPFTRQHNKNELIRLVKEGFLSQVEIAQRFEIGQSCISVAIKKLKASGKL